ncbi:hypothetical protein O181_012426 [Austropuccinia psidii MF-1]|uniref:Uncharacterized protein n=1 Tax=Austropuccinia psidii MF-1 TaxID=1389203 RepID=A0A9Q3BUL6_9BASI|nr:hypothetical protein [Austropuccinia psidii MF-1]
MSCLGARAAYRALYRSYRQSSRHPSPPIPSSINTHLRSLAIAGLEGPQLQSIVQYLASSTLYQELLRRYNPTDDLTSPERLTATVNRVGLKMPEPLGWDSSSHSSRTQES